MRFLKLFGAAFVAVVALGAVVTASAFALPSILPETVKEFTGKSTSSTTELINTAHPSKKITCKKATGLENTIEQPKPLGLFHIHFKECSAEGGIATCTGLGESESGVILVLGSWHLVYDTLSANLSADGLAILYLLGAVHFTCKFGTIEDLIVVPLGGMVLCLIPNAGGPSKVYEFKCEQTAGHQPTDTHYYNEGGTLVSIAPLLAAENEGTAEESVQVGNGTTETATATTLMT